MPPYLPNQTIKQPESLTQFIAEEEWMMKTSRSPNGQGPIRRVGWAVLALAAMVMAPGASAADPEVPGITRGAVTGQTTAKGYEHPNQYLFRMPKPIAENMEPVMVHPDPE